MKKLVAVFVTISLLCFGTMVLAEDEKTYKLVEVGTVESNENTISQSMVVENPALSLSPVTKITEEGAYMKLYSGISVSDVVRLWSDMMWLNDNTELRDVNLFLNSPGGGAFDGLAVAGWIKYFQERMGFSFNATASGIIASAAVPIFAVCKNRDALPGTIFMVHEAAMFKWPGRETASDIRSQHEMMEILRNMYLSFLVDNSSLTKEEWKEKEKRTTWFGVEDAKKWGLLERE